MSGTKEPQWTFLTNHGHVLIAIARDPGSTLRAIADAVGITERAAFRIVNDLAEGGYVTKQKVGRRNVYELDLSRPLRHPLEEHAQVRALVDVVVRGDQP